MVSAIDSGASGPGSSPGRGHSVVLLGRHFEVSLGRHSTLGGERHSHGTSLHPGV